MKTRFDIPKILIFLPLFIILTTGCKVIMKFRYGIKQPREETPAKLISFLHHEKFPDSNLYFFNDSATYIKALNNPAIRRNLLSHMIFDRRGVILERDTTRCQWSGYNDIKNLSPDSIYQTGTGITLIEMKSMISPLPGSVDPESPEISPDFTVILLWAKFLGRYNQRLFVLTDAVKSNSTARIELILLNIDMQKNWRLTKQQKLMIR